MDKTPTEGAITPLPSDDTQHPNWATNSLFSDAQLDQLRQLIREELKLLTKSMADQQRLANSPR